MEQEAFFSSQIGSMYMDLKNLIIANLSYTDRTIRYCFMKCKRQNMVMKVSYSECICRYTNGEEVVKNMC